MVQTYHPIPVPSESLLSDLAETYSRFLKAYKRKEETHIGISIFADLAFGLARWQIELSRAARYGTVVQSLGDVLRGESEDAGEASENIQEQAIGNLEEIKKRLEEVDAELSRSMEEVLGPESGTGICFCRSVDHGWMVVECGDEICELRRFHAACVGVQYVDADALEGWRCPICQGRDD